MQVCKSFCIRLYTAAYYGIQTKTQMNNLFELKVRWCDLWLTTGIRSSDLRELKALATRGNRTQAREGESVRFAVLNTTTNCFV
jgi:hypothetical protein